jgi:Mo-co oxidoreductase dimerisation domain
MLTHCLRSEWAWTLWEVALPLAKADRSQPLQLAVRAVDAAYNAQPEVGLLCRMSALSEDKPAEHGWCEVGQMHPLGLESSELVSSLLSWCAVSCANLEPAGRALQLMAPSGAELGERVRCRAGQAARKTGTAPSRCALHLRNRLGTSFVRLQSAVCAACRSSWQQARDEPDETADVSGSLGAG